MTKGKMVGWHHRFKGQALGDEGQGGLACCSPWAHKESDMMEQLNWFMHTYVYVYTLVHMYTYICTFIFFSFILFPFRLPQSIVEFPVLYSMFSLIILYIVVYICQSQSPSSSHLPSHRFWIVMFSFVSKVFFFFF